MYASGFCPTDADGTKLPCPDGYGAILGTQCICALLEIALSFIPPVRRAELLRVVSTDILPGLSQENISSTSHRANCTTHWSESHRFWIRGLGRWLRRLHVPARDGHLSSVSNHQRPSSPTMGISRVHWPRILSVSHHNLV